MNADVRVNLEKEDILEAIRHYVEMVYGKWPQEVNITGPVGLSAHASWHEESENRDASCSAGADDGEIDPEECED